MKEMFTRTQSDFALQDFWRNLKDADAQKKIQALLQENKRLIDAHNDVVRDYNALKEESQNEKKNLSQQFIDEQRLSTVLRDRLNSMGSPEEGLARWIELNIRNTKHAMLKLKKAASEDILSLADKRDINLRLAAFAFVFYEGLVELADVNDKQTENIASAEVILKDNQKDPARVVPEVIEKLADARRLSQMAEDNAFPGLPGVGSGSLKTRAKRSHEQILAWVDEGVISLPENSAEIIWHGDELHPFASMLYDNFAWIKDHLIR